MIMGEYEFKNPAICKKCGVICEKSSLDKRGRCEFCSKRICPVCNTYLVEEYGGSYSWKCPYCGYVEDE